MLPFMSTLSDASRVGQPCRACAAYLRRKRCRQAAHASTPARVPVLACFMACLAAVAVAGCFSSERSGTSLPGPAGAEPTQALAPSPARALMPILAHADVLKRFPKAAAVLPPAQFDTLTGNGLDSDVTIRQAVDGDAHWLYVINPGWWAERVELKLEPSGARTIRDPVTEAAVPTHRTQDGDSAVLDLDGWTIKVLMIQPPVGILGATVRPDRTATKELETALGDLLAVLPYLATRRPNLIPNGNFEQVDARGLPVGWKVYGWHTTDLECTTETKETPSPARFLRINNAKQRSATWSAPGSGGTAGVYSNKFTLAPGREYTLLARMAADRTGVKARLALVGGVEVSNRIALPAQKVVVDTSWREVSRVWLAPQSPILPQGAKARAEIHDDGRGVLFVDDVRLVDSTFLSYADSVATEQVVADALKPQASLYQRFAALSNPRIVRLLEKQRQRRVGNEWFLVGPFDSAAGGLGGTYPPETDFLKGVDLMAANYVGKDGREVKGILDWTIKNAGAPDYIDLAASVGPFDHSEAFAFTHAYSDANKMAKLLIGCDDGIRVWVNDSVVFTLGGERGAKPGEFVVPVDLRRGWNRVLVKVENLEKDWGFFFSLADEGGKRVAGAKYSVKAAGP